ncbi:MAG: SRPBCC domain-containing protein [Sulfobacillus sp.]
MKMTESGSFAVRSSQEEVLALVTSPEFLAKTLPDSKGYRVTGPESAVVDMLIGVSHIKGTMPTTLTILPQEDADHLNVRVAAQGLGSRVDMTLAFELQRQAEGTLVMWSSDAMISGVLASVGSGLLRPLAKRNFDAIVAAIQAAIEALYSH